MENVSDFKKVYEQMIEMIKGNNKDSCLHIGSTAPNFNAVTTFGECTLNDYKGKWLIFFSHPGDFTPVCTTEFISFAKYNDEFNKRNCCLLGLSIDSNPSHLAWVYNIYKNTGIKIPFPIIADRVGHIAKMYNMFANMEDTSTIRSVYIICPEQKIRAILQYPMTNGRSIPEILRLLEALQTSDEDNVVTPANWMPGQPVIVPYPKTFNDLLERVKNNNGYKCLDWYLCFKQENDNILFNNNNLINESNFLNTQCNCEIN